MINIVTPVSDEVIDTLTIGDQFEISGKIFCGRDAVLPRVIELVEKEGKTSPGVDLEGGVIFHTAVSPAGIGPTTSSKVEIEGSMPLLSKYGIKIHIGKGALSRETVKAMEKYHAIFAVTPPITALLTARMISQRVVAFEEEGMEAFYEIEVKCFPVIVAIAHGETIF